MLSPSIDFQCFALEVGVCLTCSVIIICPCHDVAVNFNITPYIRWLKIVTRVKWWSVFLKKNSIFYLILMMSHSLFTHLPTFANDFLVSSMCFSFTSHLHLILWMFFNLLTMTRKKKMRSSKKWKHMHIRNLDLKVQSALLEIYMFLYNF